MLKKKYYPREIKKYVLHNFAVVIIKYCPLLNIKYTTLQTIMSNIERKCYLILRSYLCLFANVIKRIYLSVQDEQGDKETSRVHSAHHSRRQELHSVKVFII